MKVYEGAILTCDANDQVARYLVEDGGRILYVGDISLFVMSGLERKH